MSYAAADLRHPARNLRLLCAIACSITAVCCCRTATAAPPPSERPALSSQIDEAVAARLVGSPAPPADDAEFLRRVHLDLVGVIPTADEVRQFQRDSDPDKRDKWIDRLLESPEHARHMQLVFDALLMERRPDKHVPRDDWRAFLRESFAENLPYDELIGEILAADGADPQTRAAAKFYLDRDAEPNLVTRDVARLVFGLDLECAQCHDHPLVDDYKQADYYGIYTYLNRSYLFTDKKNVATVAEKAESDDQFRSVFDPDTTQTGAPRLPQGTPLDEPQFEKDNAYVVAPADGVRPVPRFSRRSRFADAVRRGESRLFYKNAVNRIWAHMFGRGIVHPLHRLESSEDPPSHPELLDQLAVWFAESDCDLWGLLREIARSDAYRRSSIAAGPMSTEDAEPDRFAVANVRPLSPEQLGLSVMQATGARQAQQVSAQQQLATEDPRLLQLLDADAKRAARRREMIENVSFTKISGALNTFAQRFGKLPGTPQDQGFEATVHQALFMTNGGTVMGWLSPSGENLMARLLKLEDAAAADEMYLSILSRLPEDGERADAVAFLAEHTDAREEALREYAWSLLTCVEFRFNH